MRGSNQASWRGTRPSKSKYDRFSDASDLLLGKDITHEIQFRNLIPKNNRYYEALISFHNLFFRPAHNTPNEWRLAKN